jgi:hypothetical protein
VPEVENGPGIDEHPLLWAIVELRETVEQLIEEQKAQLARALIGARVAGEPAPRVPATSSRSIGTAATKEESSEGRRKRTPAPRPITAEPAAMATDTRLAASASVGSKVVESAGKPQDPRQRLDALAKLLDKRLKQTVEPGSRGEDD